MRDIARDLHVSIAAASLVITAMSLSFGSFMPLGGWVGNRFGRRTVYCIGTGVLSLAGIAASFAPNLGVLVALRIVQGACSATVTPLVIAILAEMYAPSERPRALSGWAAANAIGQACGPPLGGLVAAWVGWRYNLLAPALIGALTCAAALRFVPPDAGRAVPLEWRGAGALTAGALLISSAISWMPQSGPFAPPILGGLVAGALFVAVFVVTTRRAEHPFVSPSVFVEPSYVRSAVGVSTGTFMLGAAMLGIPLYLTHALRMPTSSAGFVSFALPVAMVLAARPTSIFIHRTSSTAGLRIGLTMSIVMGSTLALAMDYRVPIPLLMAIIFVLGIGLSFVHTSCAVGGTATPAARYGAGVGLANLIRVVGTTSGTAWVALILTGATADDYGFAFFGGVAVAIVGLIATFVVPRDTAAELAAA